MPIGKGSRRSIGLTSDASKLVKTVVKNENIGRVNKYHLMRRVGCFSEESLFVSFRRFTSWFDKIQVFWCSAFSNRLSARYEQTLNKALVE